MKKIISSFAMLASFAMLLSGCYPTGKTPIGDSVVVNSVADNSSQIVDADSSQSIQISDKFELEMNTPQNLPDKFPTIRLTLKTWDKNEIERLFLSNKEIESYEESDEPFYFGKKMYSWETKDKLEIVVEPGRFSYEDRAVFRGEFHYADVYGYVANDCALIDDCYAADDELSVFLSADADKRAREMIYKTGITNLGEPRVISIHADLANMILQSREDSANKHGDEFQWTPWTEDEEIYILRYPLVFENTELSMSGTTYEYTDSDSGFAIKDPGYIAVVTKDKIISLESLAAFSENYDIVENIAVNCNSENALDKFKEYLSNLVPMAATKYYRCQPVYIAYCGTSDNMTVNFKPAWEFAGYSSHKDDKNYTELENYLYRSQTYEYIWADTGHRYIEGRD